MNWSGVRVPPDPLSFIFMSKYDFGGLERCPANILRLISELEGSYQLCKYMGFEDDMNTLDEIKKRYYKLYFRTKKNETIQNSN
jgi:hypothetical protein